ncbi:MAG: NADH-quinone oxidoreductase subunit D [Propionibacteriaceae bacterium]|nr:NADH-quinone oxidoreductase subunit D [Propionibacteriaceae bacterium]
MSVTTYSIGAIGLTGTTDLDLGPHHPTKPGLTLLKVEETDGHVHAADLQPGYLHRGAEKLFEARDYRSVLMLADRHDWLAAFSGELVVTLTVEHAMGLLPTQRAIWLRVYFAEAARLHSHLCYLSYLPFIANDEPLAEAIQSHTHALREALASCTGNRVHPMLNRLGGISHEPGPAALAAVSAAAAGSAATLRLLRELLGDLPQLRVGALTPEDVDQYGLSGPTAAASGVRADVRDTGYLAYAELPQAPSPADTTGDAFARFAALIRDAEHSITLIDKAIHLAPEGPVNVKLAKIIKVPEGSYAGQVAAPWGTAGCHLVSRGDRTPWRLGLRTPTFANCSALSRALVGCPVEAIPHVVASLGYGIGDLDR